jgi:hypothetical protein
MEKWLASFEIAFPAKTVEELLLALVVRDLVYGSSFDVESEESDEQFQVDVTASEEVDDEGYQLFVEAEITDTENQELAGEFLEQMLEGAVDEAEALVGARRNLGVRKQHEIEFRVVQEESERWDLVIPDWLAPEEAEVPFGFRGYLKETGEALPSDRDLDASGRIVMVPMDDEVHLVAIPAPQSEDSCEESGES